MMGLTDILSVSRSGGGLERAAKRVNRVLRQG